MNNNTKRFLGYFGYMVFIGITLYWGAVLEHYLEKQVARTFETRVIIIYNTFFPVILGMLLALPRFINTVRKPGRWSMDWVKLLGVGLPAFYTAFFMLGYFTLGNFLPSWFFWPGLKLLGLSSVPITVFGIIFGYTLLSAVDRED